MIELFIRLGARVIPLLKSLYTVTVVAAFTLTGCLSTEPKEPVSSRATLAELAMQQSELSLAGVDYSKAQRAEKLATIYQQLLTLEPNPEVRTQVEYRLVQINTQMFESQTFGALAEPSDQAELNSAADEDALTLAQLKENDQALGTLVANYKRLLTRYPNRPDNEHVQYQYAKALDLQGKLDESLAAMENLLTTYPETNYKAELHFRRGEIYYNLQHYQAALTAYEGVINARFNEKYLINSIYMSGWAKFKLNRLASANQSFLTVFDEIIAAEKRYPYADDFTFDALNTSYKNLILDTQRILSISLSQQQQSQSLVQLINANATSKHLYLYQHILFKNLADFLLVADLTHDAELTYQAYLTLAPNNIWAARFSQDLLTLFHQQGKFASMHELKRSYVQQFGLASEFWQSARAAQQEEVLPYLLEFSEENSRRLYAFAQEQVPGQQRIESFAVAAEALAVYLQFAKLPQAKELLTKNILADEYLLADANFEAQQYSSALKQYEYIAYQTSPLLVHDVESSDDSISALKLEAAYATTVTIREMLASVMTKNKQMVDNTRYQQFVTERNRLDKAFMKQYPKDQRSFELATHAAQYMFDTENHQELDFNYRFVMNGHGVTPIDINKATTDARANLASPAFNPNAAAKKWPAKARKQVQIVSQLYAHSLYQQQNYQAAEPAYASALTFVEQTDKTWKEMRELLSSSIYFQAEALKTTHPLIAVEHLLRLGQRIPESSYRVTAEFDAANLLLAGAKWQQAVDVLLAFKQRYPEHKYSATIPAKLAKSYESLAQWDLAAQQLMIIVSKETSPEIKREAQYMAADYFLKAGDTEQARLAFRSYAHAYPQPFNVAQEVRFKMSEFYRESKEPNKQYFWYRKILSFHKKQQKAAPQAIQTRAIELASTAAFGLGQAHQQTFKWIKLKAPLQKSLKRKQKAMKQAIDYYQQVLNFQLAKSVPQATFNLAEMYRQLAADVMRSERPNDLDELALEEYEIVLEELAYPFEEKAIEIHISNTQSAWQDIYDPWIAKSFATLATLSPALYKKQERTHEVIHAIH